MPDAEVIQAGGDTYPIRVTLKDEEGEVIWSGSQRDMFRKYASNRMASVLAIKAALKKRYSLE